MEKERFGVKAILLDLDGTLVDSRKAYLEAVKTALTAIGQKTIDIRVVTEIPKRIEQGLSMHDLLDGIDTETFLNAYLSAYYEATAEKTVPMPNITNTLERLSAKAKLALVTMRHTAKEKVVSELERFGLARYFEFVLTALDSRLPKPSPDALLQCADRMGISIGDCMVVGDSVADVKAGKSAGAKTVAVLSGIFSRAELEKEKPDLIIENVSMLPDFIE